MSWGVPGVMGSLDPLLSFTLHFGLCELGCAGAGGRAGQTLAEERALGAAASTG